MVLAGVREGVARALEDVDAGGGGEGAAEVSGSAAPDAEAVAAAESAAPEGFPALGPVDWPSPTEPFWERLPAAPAQPAAAGPASASESDLAASRPLSIVHVAAEMAPIAKVGGLGDVVTGLARSCAARGHRLEVILPYYECLPEDEISGLEYVTEFWCPKAREWDGREQDEPLRTLAYRGEVEGCPVLLLRPDWDSSPIFRGDRVYGGSYNEVEAYLYFCRASLELLKVTGRQPDIIHLHEWQCAAAAMLYWDLYHSDALPRSRIVLTIHNMDNTGEVRADEFLATGVGGEQYATIERALDERTIGHNPERLSLLKGGIVYSNAVTTVSPTYAEETRSGHGGWLGGTLSLHSQKYHGVLNGIDTDMWDPATDPFLPAPFGAEGEQDGAPATLEGKEVCQKFVRRGLGLAEPEDGARVPIVVCVSRLVPQKGIHLIRHALHRTVEQGGQFVLLGSGHADGDFRALAENEFKDHPNVKLLVMYNEALSHHLFAAADVVLVPSMFEPCGLTQMIGLRYGGLPLVRKTGGLADTVVDVDDTQAPESEKNGFVFEGSDEGSLDGALDRALKYYRERPEWWASTVQRAMGQDFSWEKSSEEYLQIYDRVTA